MGSAVQLVTNGLKATEYRPVDSDKAVDILVRFPPDRRSLDQIDELRVQTQAGHVPIGNFVTRFPVQRVGYINRVNANRVMTVSANVAEGVQTAIVQAEIARELAQPISAPASTFKLKGEDEERAKAGAFLMKAFGTAIFLIFAILLAQFNRLTSVGLVLSAVVMSTFGVLLGLMFMGQPFGVVMTGIGVIANAGVIVNNNIVLIDTYDRLRREGVAAYDAILETCRERARPVVLTAVTAILGVLPIAFGVNVEFLSREMTVGAPATQWWINLSTAIVFGLGFATVLTLVVTPAALMGIEKMRLWRIRTVARLRGLLARRRRRGCRFSFPPRFRGGQGGALSFSLLAPLADPAPTLPEDGEGEGRVKSAAWSRKNDERIQEHRGHRRGGADAGRVQQLHSRRGSAGRGEPLSQEL